MDTKVLDPEWIHREINPEAIVQVSQRTAVGAKIVDKIPQQGWIKCTGKVTPGIGRWDPKGAIFGRIKKDPEFMRACRSVTTCMKRA